MNFSPYHLPRFERFNSAGITLVEVLVALVIVALALGAGLNVSGAVTNNVTRLENVVLAQWCAENILLEMRLTGNLPVTNSSEENCAQIGKNFLVKIESESTPNPMFKKMNIRVLDEYKNSQFSIKTVLPVNSF
jgi:general secretion pathway protein I